MFVGCGGNVEEDSTEINITVKVIVDAKETVFEIATEKATLDEALLGEGLIAGDQSEFGLFVHTVNGVKVDEENDEWWMITKGGEAVMVGISQVDIADGDVFELTLVVGF